MLKKIIKVTCQILGGIYVIVKLRKQWDRSIHGLQDAFRARLHQIGVAFLIGYIILTLLGFGILFLLLGLAYWCNTLLTNPYVGFFIVAFLCFLLILSIAFIIRKKVSHSLTQLDKVAQEADIPS